MTLKTFGMAAVIAVAAAGFVFSPGAAKADTPCTFDWKPVCGTDHGWTHTFFNACWAKLSGAKVLYAGECGNAPKEQHKAKKAAKKSAAPAKKEMKKEEKK